MPGDFIFQRADENVSFLRSQNVMQAFSEPCSLVAAAFRLPHDDDLKRLSQQTRFCGFVLGAAPFKVRDCAVFKKLYLLPAWTKVRGCQNRVRETEIGTEE